MVVPFYTPASNEWEIQLFCIFSNICHCRFFNFSHSFEHVVIINYDFIWVPWWLTMLAIFKCVYWLFVYCVCVCVCVWEVSVQNFFPSWHLVDYLFLFLVSSLYNQDTGHFSEYVLNTFFQPHTCFSLFSMCLWLNSTFHYWTAIFFIYCLIH